MRVAAALVTIGVAVAGCEKKSGEPAPSRVNGAKVADANPEATLEAFCDVRASGDKGAVFQWPALASPAPGPANGWRWVNVWATWCKPCLDEMPRIVKWRDKLAAAGKKIDLVFVSVDESEADVAEYKKKHPDAPPTLRMMDPEKKMPPWFKSLGLGEAPPVPIHVFVGPGDHIHCARAGAVNDPDYAIVERVLAE